VFAKQPFLPSARRYTALLKGCGINPRLSWGGPRHRGRGPPMLSYFYQLLRQIEPLSRRAQIVGQRPVATLVFICSAVLLATIGYAGPPVYNPYPPGILPPDLDAEISRVRSVNLTIVAYPGTFHFRAGKRAAQRYTYAPQFPVLHFNQRSRHSSAARSGMRARRGTDCRIPTPNRRSIRRYPGNGLPRHSVHRVADIPSAVQITLRAGLGLGLRNQLAGRY
jgi:hypothetical protein